jgi:hypothetical protein
MGRRCRSFPPRCGIVSKSHGLPFQAAQHERVIRCHASHRDIFGRGLENLHYKRIASFNAHTSPTELTIPSFTPQPANQSNTSARALSMERKEVELEIYLVSHLPTPLHRPLVATISAPPPSGSHTPRSNSAYTCSCPRPSG